MKLFNRKSPVVILVLFLILGLASFMQAGTTGKIAGKITDKESGEPLPGANIVIVGTNLGGAADVNGNFFILNIPPGSYSVRATMVGYGAITTANVRVNLDLTTNLDFQLTVETIQGEEITIVSTRPVVQPDVSANIAAVNAVEMENIPIAGVTEAIDLQAGIEPGMIIRGGSLDQVNFSLDGISMRDGRNNQPYSNISYTSVEEVQVQTGGFNAEYGNVRSGLINVITKDVSKEKFAFDVLMRYRSPNDMHFGPGLFDDNAYWIRPYFDPAVSEAGTKNGTWDKYTQAQYPEFDGWESVPSELSSDQLKELYRYHMRKFKSDDDTDLQDPKKELDMTLSGPLIPGLSKKLGNLRFSLSYRSVQDPYFYPQRRTSLTDDAIQYKVISNFGVDKKLTINGLFGKQQGMAYTAGSSIINANPQPGGIPTYTWGDVNAPGQGSTMINQTDGHVGRSMLYANDRYVVTDLKRNMIGANFTHTLDPSTFYELQVSQLKSKYNTGPDVVRDTTKVHQIGNQMFSEAPFGWTDVGTSGLGSGMRLGGHWGRARDTSVVTLTTLKGDITKQYNTYNQVKAGFEFNNTNYDMNFGAYDDFFVDINRYTEKYNRTAKYFSAYAQDKLEFKGMIANVGLRFEYFTAGGEFLDTETFDRHFTATGALKIDEVPTKKVKGQAHVSPRLGVSFPITMNSKLYFNYGHFRQILDPRNFYTFGQNLFGQVRAVGNPEHPMPKTVAYELGYDHNLLDQYLFRISGYYRDNTQNARGVFFQSVDTEVQYVTVYPQFYEDVRGLELTLNKARGRYFRGFINYTHHQYKNGNFDFGQFNENQVQQTQYEQTTTDHYQNKPVSQPFASMSLEFLSPEGFGPAVAGFRPLDNWSASFLGNWRKGQTFTWTDNNPIPGLLNNIRMKDFWSLDLRLAKNVKTKFGRAQLFVDINNIFNLKQMYFDPNNHGNVFYSENSNDRDWQSYMKSLHLSSDIWKDNDGKSPYDEFIPGDDKPGDYRDYDVDYVPIEWVANTEGLNNLGDQGYLEPGRRVLYYNAETKSYFEYNSNSGAYETADKSFVNKVMEDKAYIDMPNYRHRWFLNPRTVMFGFRLTF